MKNKICVIVCFLSLKVFSQTILSVDTLVKNGPIDKRINLVILGDGFTTAQMPQFINSATSLTNYLLNASPFSNYKKYFNVYAIQCPSPQSGVSHPGNATDVTEPASPVVSVVNNFNTRFDCYGTHRSIYSMNPSAVWGVVSAGFPAYDQVVILGNSTVYGGTGGPYAVSSLNSASPETVVHEMGHSFAGLADEYWAGTVFANEKPNMTAVSNTASIKWTQWLATNNTGIYPYDTGAVASAWFRPHQGCKMRFLNAPFCSVCKQTIIEKIHSLTNPIDAYFPDTAVALIPLDTSHLFKSALIDPIPNTLKRTWTLNSTVIASNVDSVVVPKNLFVQSNNLLTLAVMDTTLLSRDVNHANFHSYSVAWKIGSFDVGIKEIRPQVKFSIFPNPASDVINLNYTLLESSEIAFSVADISGKTLISERTARSAPGEYKKTINIKELSEGNYVLALKINGQLINNKFVVFK